MKSVLSLFVSLTILVPQSSLAAKKRRKTPKSPSAAVASSQSQFPQTSVSILLPDNFESLSAEKKVEAMLLGLPHRPHLSEFRDAAKKAGLSMDGKNPWGYSSYDSQVETLRRMKAYFDEELNQGPIHLVVLGRDAFLLGNIFEGLFEGNQNVKISFAEASRPSFDAVARESQVPSYEKQMGLAAATAIVDFFGNYGASLKEVLTSPARTYVLDVTSYRPSSQLAMVARAFYRVNAENGGSPDALADKFVVISTGSNYQDPDLLNLKPEEWNEVRKKQRNKMKLDGPERPLNFDISPLVYNRAWVGLYGPFERVNGKVITKPMSEKDFGKREEVLAELFAIDVALRKALEAPADFSKPRVEKPSYGGGSSDSWLSGSSQRSYYGGNNSGNNFGNSTTGSYSSTTGTSQSRIVARPVSDVIKILAKNISENSGQMVSQTVDVITSRTAGTLTDADILDAAAEITRLGVKGADELFSKIDSIKLINTPERESAYNLLKAAVKKYLRQLGKIGDEPMESELALEMYALVESQSTALMGSHRMPDDVFVRKMDEITYLMHRHLIAEEVRGVMMEVSKWMESEKNSFVKSKIQAAIDRLKIRSDVMKTRLEKAGMSLDVVAEAPAQSQSKKVSEFRSVGYGALYEEREKLGLAAKIRNRANAMYQFVQDLSLKQMDISNAMGFAAWSYAEGDISEVEFNLLLKNYIKIQQEMGVELLGLRQVQQEVWNFLIRHPHSRVYEKHSLSEIHRLRMVGNREIVISDRLINAKRVINNKIDELITSLTTGSAAGACHSQLDVK